MSEIFEICKESNHEPFMISRVEYNKLVQERNEYREIAIDYMNKFDEIQEKYNLDNSQEEESL